MPLRSEFNRYFKQVLSPYGFVKLKGTNIFAKLVDDTILQYFTFQGCSSLYRRKKAFCMSAGVDTIYAETLSKPHLQAFALPYPGFRSVDRSISRSDAFWGIHHYDENSIVDALQDAANETIDVILPHVTKVDSLEKYIEFCKYMSSIRLEHADRLQYDSLLLIKTNNHESFYDRFEFLASSLNENSAYTSEQKRELLRRFREGIQDGIVAPRDRVYADPELLKKVEEELLRRQLANKAMLRSYNLTVN